VDSDEIVAAFMVFLNTFIYIQTLCHGQKLQFYILFICLSTTKSSQQKEIVH